MSRRRKQKIYPANWIWPFNAILWFRQYRKWINKLEPEDIGRLRKEIDVWGFCKGCQIFDIYIGGTLTMRAYDAKKGLQDIADGKEPGQTRREFEEKMQRERELEQQRNYKQQKMEELQQEIRNAELDRVNLDDIQKSIDKIKRFGGK